MLVQILEQTVFEKRNWSFELSEFYHVYKNELLHGSNFSVWYDSIAQDVPGAGRDALAWGRGRFSALSLTASEPRGNNLTRFKDFNLQATARIWPWLSYMCHIQ